VPAVVLGLVGTAWSGALTFAALNGHARFGTGAYDLAIFDQAIWLISRGLAPYSTVEGLHILGDHGSFLTYPLAGLYLIWDDVRALLTFQVLATALGVVPLFLMGARRKAPWTGVVVAIGYLLHPSTINVVTFDFHPDPLSGTALLFAFWAIEAERPIVAVLALAAVAAGKESFALTVVAFGIWLVFRRKWRLGVPVALVALVWLVFVVRVVLPAHNGIGHAYHLDRFKALGGSTSEILIGVVRHPFEFLATLGLQGAWGYSLLLLAPLGFLPLLGPGTLWIAGPAWGLNVLSSFEPQRTAFFHYAVLIVPVACVSALGGLLALRERYGRDRLVVAGAFLAVGLGYAATYRPDRLRLAAFATGSDGGLSLRYRQLLAAIPEEASVSVQSRFAPHLSHRRQVWLFPNPFWRYEVVNPAGAPEPPSVEYIVFDTRNAVDGHPWPDFNLHLIRTFQERGIYDLIAEREGALLLRRTTRQIPPTCFGAGWQDHWCQAPAPPR